MRRRDHDGVFFGYDDDILAVGAVRTEGVVAAAPHLVAVALDPVVVLGREPGVGGVRRIGLDGLEHPLVHPGIDAGNLLRGHFLHPVGGNHLPAIEFAPVQDAKAHPGEVLRLQVQAPAAGVDAGRALLPERFLDAQGLPQARLQIIDDLLARHLLDGGGKDVRAQAVVAIACAGLILQRPFHEAAHPVAVPAAGGAGRVGSVAGVHRQEMPDGDPLQGVRGILRNTFREQVHNLVVQVQEALRNGEADGRGRERLGHGIEDVRRVGDEELFLEHLSVLEDHHAVQVLGAVGDGLEIGGESFIHLRGSLGARERAVSAGAGCQEDGRQKEGQTFHRIGFYAQRY